MSANENVKIQTTASTDNQNEIDQIMNEIEQLQKEMGDSEPVAAPMADVPQEISAELSEASEVSEEDRSMSEFVTIDEEATTVPSAMIEEVIAQETLATSHSNSAPVQLHRAKNETYTHEQGTSAGTPQGTAENTLTVNIEGNFNFKFHHVASGQDVLVNFGADAIRVTLANGAEFKIPVSRASLKRVA